MKIGDIIRYTGGGLIGIIVDICPAPFKGGPPWITVAFPAGVSSPMSSYGFEIMSKQ